MQKTEILLFPLYFRPNPFVKCLADSTIIFKGLCILLHPNYVVDFLVSDRLFCPANLVDGAVTYGLTCSQACFSKFEKNEKKSWG